MRRKLICFILFFTLFPFCLDGQMKFIECDSVFPYRGANWKYGLSSTNGRLVAEPQFEEIILTKKNKGERYFLFINRETNKSGIISSSGEILTSDLPGMPQYHTDFDIKGCIINYINFEQDLVVYSGCLKKLVGVFKKGKINRRPGVARVTWNKSEKAARPDFVIGSTQSSPAKYYNGMGEMLTFENEDDKIFCSSRYNYYYPSEYQSIKKSTSNVDTYQSYFPQYKIVEEYFNGEGSISILAKKERKYGLINSKGEVLLPFNYKHIEFSKGLLIIHDGYRGVAECSGDILYDPMFTYVSLNDPDKGLILIDSYMGCRGYCDFYGNIFLPSDCLKQE